MKTSKRKYRKTPRMHFLLAVNFPKVQYIKSVIVIDDNWTARKLMNAIGKCDKRLCLKELDDPYKAGRIYATGSTGKRRVIAKYIHHDALMLRR